MQKTTFRKKVWILTLGTALYVGSGAYGISRIGNPSALSRALQKADVPTWH